MLYIFFFFFGVCIQSPFGVLDFATHCVQECLNRTFPFPDLPYEIITTHIILGCHKISEWQTEWAYYINNIVTLTQTLKLKVSFLNLSTAYPVERFKPTKQQNTNQNTLDPANISTFREQLDGSWKWLHGKSENLQWMNL